MEALSDDGFRVLLHREVPTNDGGVSLGQAVIDSMADYAQNESNRTFIKSRLAAHMSGYDGWANYFTRDKLLDTIANPPARLVVMRSVRSSTPPHSCSPTASITPSAQW